MKPRLPQPGGSAARARAFTCISPMSRDQLSAWKRSMRAGIEGPHKKSTWSVVPERASSKPLGSVMSFAVCSKRGVGVCSSTHGFCAKWIVDVNPGVVIRPHLDAIRTLLLETNGYILLIASYSLLRNLFISGRWKTCFHGTRRACAAGSVSLLQVLLVVGFQRTATR